MPPYEFDCLDCGREFTLILSVQDYENKKKITCPGCGSDKVERLVTSCQVVTARKS